MKEMTRRKWFETVGVAGLAVSGASAGFAADNLIRKAIPATGEMLPAVGLGSWQRFDIPPSNQAGRQTCTEVMREFFKLGGGMIDSSPMYGQAQDVIGQGLREIGDYPTLFSATKVWIEGRQAGIDQMEEALRLWGLDRFDLIQVHNMVDWAAQLPWLYDWQAQDRVRYVGITTSHGSNHSEMEKLMRSESFEFVQFTYSLANKQAEARLLPLAQETSKAVIVNRAFQGGNMFSKVRGKPLPDFAAEIDCHSWGQFFLKWVISHPAVTCVIPATSKLDHLEDNMGAMRGVLPDEDQREEMAKYYDSIT